ncbi:MND1 [Candida metapsilosis]|uniref:Meiotic nuclear division protein 1 n=1 Tax=Candida metapsilosis TaxID=273372 RepID=A0A8H8DD23_9ASCO|nr:MND1 [Candida metapsilosis]
MAPKKTVSHEEKLKILHSWFQSSHDFYTLKEIEQKASKACKIPGMQVKELVSNLVDEGLIQQEKSGTTNLYWSFTYTDMMSKIEKAKRLKHDLETKRKFRDQLQHELEVLQTERSADVVPERSSQLKELNELYAEVDQLSEQNKQLQQYQEVEKLKAGIEFFADSIEIMISWLSNQSGVQGSELKKEMGIPLDLDNYDLKPM